MRREICWAAVSVFVCRWCCWVVRIRLVEQLEPALTNQLTGLPFCIGRPQMSRGLYLARRFVLSGRLMRFSI